MCSLFSSGFDKAAKIQSNAQLEGAGQRETQEVAGRGEYRGIVDPYLQSGQTGINYLQQAYGSPDQQQQALQTYQGSPSYNLLQQAQEDAARRHQGTYAAQGMGNSGAMVESLGRRLSDMSLSDYYQYQQGAQNLGSLGQNTALNAGGNILQSYGRVGDIQATGTIGSGNALAQGQIAGQQAFNSLVNTGISAIGKIGGAFAGNPGAPA